MREEIAVENGRISVLQGLVTLTMDRVILHTVMRHSSTPNFTEIEETLWMNVPTDGHLRPTLLGQLGGVDLKMNRAARFEQLSPVIPYVVYELSTITLVLNYRENTLKCYGPNHIYPRLVAHDNRGVGFFYCLFSARYLLNRRSYRLTKLDNEMLQDQLRKPIYFVVKSSKVTKTLPAWVFPLYGCWLFLVVIANVCCKARKVMW